MGRFPVIFPINQSIDCSWSPYSFKWHQSQVKTETRPPLPSLPCHRSDARNLPGWSWPIVGVGSSRWAMHLEVPTHPRFDHIMQVLQAILLGNHPLKEILVSVKNMNLRLPQHFESQNPTSHHLRCFKRAIFAATSSSNGDPAPPLLPSPLAAAHLRCRNASVLATLDTTQSDPALSP